jgi:serine/threonine-protein kinase 24/25/MST4
MAPEVMLKSGHDQKADIWSLGITAIELALGKAPYSEFEYGKVMKLILNCEPPNLPEEAWSDEFRNFITACTTKIPDYRPSIEQLMQDHAGFLGKARNA